MEGLEELRLILEVAGEAGNSARYMFYTYMAKSFVTDIIFSVLLVIGGKGAVKLVKYLNDNP